MIMAMAMIATIAMGSMGMAEVGLVGVGVELKMFVSVML